MDVQVVVEGVIDPRLVIAIEEAVRDVFAHVPHVAGAWVVGVAPGDTRTLGSWGPRPRLPPPRLVLGGRRARPGLCQGQADPFSPQWGLTRGLVPASTARRRRRPCRDGTSSDTETFPWSGM
jgi:hypothetical protein